MSFYRRAWCVFNALRRAMPRTPIHKSTPVITRNPSSSSFYGSYNSRVSGFSRFPLFSSISSRINGPKGGYPNPFFGGTRRCYYADRYNVQYFKPRGRPPRWFQNLKKVLTVVVGSGVLATAYFEMSETIPYTNRKQFVLLSRNIEKAIGEVGFEMIKETYKGKILPEMHPYSVRVRLITNDIIKALQKRGLTHVRSPRYAALMEIPPAKRWRKDDEIVDDKRVHRSPKKAQERGSSLNWEVLVVNEPDVNAFCLPGGKIVVFTGLLQHFKTDAEIATIIGHEVGHAVARHAAEGITKHLGFSILELITNQFINMPNVVDSISILLLRLPFSRRTEMEADYIGMLLMASAGYDPRIAPTVYEEMGKMAGEDSIVKDYLSTHPSGEKRAQMLAQANVMEEAMTLYLEARPGRRRIQGFLQGIIRGIVSYLWE